MPPLGLCMDLLHPELDPLALRLFTWLQAPTFRTPKSLCPTYYFPSRTISPFHGRRSQLPKSLSFTAPCRALDRAIWSSLACWLSLSPSDTSGRMGSGLMSKNEYRSSSPPIRESYSKTNMKWGKEKKDTF